MVNPPYDDDDERRRKAEAIVKRAEDALWRDALSAEDLRRIEAQWKSDVDLKLDRLCSFAETYENYLALCLKREQTKDKIRAALIEKTLAGFIWAVLGLMGLAIWQYILQYIRDHPK
jgi:hypothetical protein